MPITRATSSLGPLFVITIRTVGRVIVNKPRAPVTGLGARVYIPNNGAVATAYAGLGLPIEPRRIPCISRAFEDENQVFVVVFFPPPLIEAFLRDLLAYTGKRVEAGGSYLIQFFTSNKMRTITRVPLSLVSS
ncbi:MAG: hypothetical protein ACPGO5_00210 [Patescibacteria group bacterium]